MQLKLKGGVRIALPDQLDSISSYVALEQEDWFEDEIQFVRALAFEGMQAIDIGASFGFYTLALANNVGNSGRIFSFEPNSSTRDFLHRSVHLNGINNVKLLPIAVSDKDGTSTLYYSKASELGSIIPELETSNQSREEIDTRSLDSLHSELNFSGVEFIKIDAEGAEGRIIDGGCKYLEQFSPLVMHEVKRGRMVDFSVCHKLKEQGYENYRLVPGLNCLTPINIEEGFDDYLLNVFSCKADRSKILQQKKLLTRREKIPNSECLNSIDWSIEFDASPIGRVVSPSLNTVNTEDIAGHDRYYYALNYYAYSRVLDGSLSLRVGALNFAASELTSINEKNSNFVRLCSLARVAFEFGLRGTAVEALHKLTQHINAGNFNIAERFVMVAPEFDNIDPKDELGLWFSVSILEQLAKLSVFSGRFGGDDYYECLKAIRGHKCAGPETERRWQLFRLLNGHQKKLERTKQLTKSDPDNLNPSFWRGEDTNKL